MQNKKMILGSETDLLKYLKRVAYNKVNIKLVVLKNRAEYINKRLMEYNKEHNTQLTISDLKLPPWIENNIHKK